MAFHIHGRRAGSSAQDRLVRGLQDHRIGSVFDSAARGRQGHRQALGPSRVRCPAAGGRDDFVGKDHVADLERRIEGAAQTDAEHAGDVVPVGRQAQAQQVRASAPCHGPYAGTLNDPGFSDHADDSEQHHMPNATWRVLPWIRLR